MKTYIKRLFFTLLATTLPSLGWGQGTIRLCETVSFDNAKFYASVKLDGNSNTIWNSATPGAARPDMVTLKDSNGTAILDLNLRKESGWYVVVNGTEHRLDTYLTDITVTFEATKTEGVWGGIAVTVSGKSGNDVRTLTGTISNGNISNIASVEIGAPIGGVAIGSVTVTVDNGTSTTVKIRTISESSETWDDTEKWSSLTDSNVGLISNAEGASLNINVDATVKSLTVVGNNALTLTGNNNTLNTLTATKTSINTDTDVSGITANLGAVTIAEGATLTIGQNTTIGSISNEVSSHGRLILKSKSNTHQINCPEGSQISISEVADTDGYYSYILKPKDVDVPTPFKSVSFNGSVNLTNEVQFGGMYPTANSIQTVGLPGNNQALQITSSYRPHTADNDGNKLKVENGSWTIACFVKPTSCANNGIIFSIGKPAGYVALTWNIENEQTNGCFAIVQNGSSIITSTSSYNKDAWHLVVLTYDKVSQRVYLKVNNAEDVSTGYYSTFNLPTGTMQIGSVHGGLPTNFACADNAYVDEWKIWKAALSEYQTQQLVAPFDGMYYADVNENTESSAVTLFGNGETKSLSDLTDKEYANYHIKNGVTLTLKDVPNTANVNLWGTGSLNLESGELQLSSGNNYAGKVVIGKDAILDLHTKKAKLFRNSYLNLNEALTIQGTLKTQDWTYSNSLGSLGSNDDYVKIDGGTVIFPDGNIDDTQTRGFIVTENGAILEVPTSKVYYHKSPSDVNANINNSNNGILQLTGGGVYKFNGEVVGTTSVASNTTIAQGSFANLTLNSGATIDTTAGAITVSGDVTITSGDVTITDDATVNVVLKDTPSVGDAVIKCTNASDILTNLTVETPYRLTTNSENATIIEVAAVCHDGSNYYPSCQMGVNNLSQQTTEITLIVTIDTKETIKLPANCTKLTLSGTFTGTVTDQYGNTLTASTTETGLTYTAPVDTDYVAQIGEGDALKKYLTMDAAIAAGAAANETVEIITLLKDVSITGATEVGQTTTIADVIAGAYAITITEGSVTLTAACPNYSGSITVKANATLDIQATKFDPTNDNTVATTTTFNQETTLTIEKDATILLTQGGGYFSFTGAGTIKAVGGANFLYGMGSVGNTFSANLEVPVDKEFHIRAWNNCASLGGGNITINGTIVANGGHSGACKIAVANGKTLSGNGTISKATDDNKITLTLEDGAIIDATAGAVTANGTVTLPATGTVNVKATNGRYGTVLTASSLNAEKFALTEGITGTLKVVGNDLVYTLAITEPDDVTLPVEALVQISNAANSAGVTNVTNVSCANDGKVSVAGLELFDGIVSITADETDSTSGTATVSYAFGITSIGVVVVTDENGDTGYCPRVTASVKQVDGKTGPTIVDGVNVGLYKVTGEEDYELLGVGEADGKDSVTFTATKALPAGDFGTTKLAVKATTETLEVTN